MRRAARTDDNKREIVEFFKARGCYVIDIKIPVDICIGYRGKTVFIEIKDGSKAPSRQKHTKLQTTFLSEWPGGPVVTIRDIAGAETLVRMLDNIAAT